MSDKVRILLLLLHRFHGETMSSLSEVKQNHLLIIYPVCCFYIILQSGILLWDTIRSWFWLQNSTKINFSYRTLINHSFCP
jgi:hypothetical protein